MTKIVKTLQKQLETKGTEINTYRETHNLKIKTYSSMTKIAETFEKQLETKGTEINAYIERLSRTFKVFYH